MNRAKVSDVLEEVAALAREKLAALKEMEEVYACLAAGLQERLVSTKAAGQLGRLRAIVQAIEKIDRAAAGPAGLLAEYLQECSTAFLEELPAWQEFCRLQEEALACLNAISRLNQDLTGAVRQEMHGITDELRKTSQTKQAIASYLPNYKAAAGLILNRVK